MADFPPAATTDWHFQPRGALTSKIADDHVRVNMGNFNIECRPNHKTWHYTVSDEASGISGVHTGTGFPTWYGKETPQIYTPHCRVSVPSRVPGQK